MILLAIAVTILTGEAAAQPMLPPGYLGVSTRAEGSALVIDSVRGDSPAEAAGLLPGDRIIGIGGMPLRRGEDLSAMLRGLAAGSRVELQVISRGRTRSVAVSLGLRPDDPPGGVVTGNDVPTVVMPRVLGPFPLPQTGGNVVPGPGTGVLRPGGGDGEVGVPSWDAVPPSRSMETSPPVEPGPLSGETVDERRPTEPRSVMTAPPGERISDDPPPSRDREPAITGGTARSPERRRDDGRLPPPPIVPVDDEMADEAGFRPPTVPNAPRNVDSGRSASAPSLTLLPPMEAPTPSATETRSSAGMPSETGQPGIVTPGTEPPGSGSPGSVPPGAPTPGAPTPDLSPPEPSASGPAVALERQQDGRSVWIVPGWGATFDGEPQSVERADGSRQAGLTIRALEDVSPLRAAGLRVDAIVTSLDDSRILNAEQFHSVLREAPSDRPIRLEFIQNGVRQAVGVEKPAPVPRPVPSEADRPAAASAATAAPETPPSPAVLPDDPKSIAPPEMVAQPESAAEPERMAPPGTRTAPDSNAAGRPHETLPPPPEASRTTPSGVEPSRTEPMSRGEGPTIAPAFGEFAAPEGGATEIGDSTVRPGQGVLAPKTPGTSASPPRSPRTTRPSRPTPGAGVLNPYNLPPDQLRGYDLLGATEPRRQSDEEASGERSGPEAASPPDTSAPAAMPEPSRAGPMNAGPMNAGPTNTDPEKTGPGNGPSTDDPARRDPLPLPPPVSLRASPAEPGRPMSLPQSSPAERPEDAISGGVDDGSLPGGSEAPVEMEIKPPVRPEIAPPPTWDEFDQLRNEIKLLRDRVHLLERRVHELEGR